MMNKRSTVDFPDDLVVEILSRVPTISLARFRSTSKAWNALVKDERFSKKHSAPRQSLAIMLIGFRVYLVSANLRGTQENEAGPSRKLTRQFSLKDPLSDSSEEVDICNVFHCDGLLLCKTKEDRLVVWNPVSGETKWIQPRNSYKKFDLYDLFALGYDNKSSCYKIIKMYRSVDGSGVGEFQTDYDVYDFTSNSWSVVGMTTDWYVPWSRTRGVSVKGNTYWLARSGLRDSNTLLSFDFSTERFQTHSLPQSLRRSDVALSVVREDQLCLLGVNPLNVWITSKIESTKAMSWSKFLTAKPNYTFSRWISFLADEQNKVLVCYDSMINNVSNNILHIVGEDRYIQVTLPGSTSSYFSFLLSYVPTLVQIQQGI